MVVSFTKAVDADSVQWLVEDDDGAWSAVSVDDEDGAASSYIQGLADDAFMTTLRIASIRTASSGFCVDEARAQSHLLREGGSIRFKVRVSSAKGDEHFDSGQSAQFAINEAPHGGECAIQNLATPRALQDEFAFVCSGWSGTALSYNALMNGVLLSPSFAHRASAVRDSFGGVSCQHFVAAFPALSLKSAVRVIKLLPISFFIVHVLYFVPTALLRGLSADWLMKTEHTCAHFSSTNQT